MARFSRGVRPAETRDLRRILDATEPGRKLEVAEAARRLLEELAEDPHEKGVEDAQDWCPNLRILQIGPVKAFFAVRSPDDRYVEVLGFSTA